MSGAVFFVYNVLFLFPAIGKWIWYRSCTIISGVGCVFGAVGCKDDGVVFISDDVGRSISLSEESVYTDLRLDEPEYRFRNVCNNLCVCLVCFRRVADKYGQCVVSTVRQQYESYIVASNHFSLFIPVSGSCFMPCAYRCSGKRLWDTVFPCFASQHGFLDEILIG